MKACVQLVQCETTIRKHAIHLRSRLRHGKSLYYYRDRAIWKSTLMGEAEARVVDNPEGQDFRLRRNAVWLLDSSTSPAQFDVLDLSTHKQTRLGVLDIGPPARTATGFDISPDGRTIIYARVDALESDIMLVENFHCSLKI